MLTSIKIIYKDQKETVKPLALVNIDLADFTPDPETDDVFGVHPIMTFGRDSTDVGLVIRVYGFSKKFVDVELSFGIRRAILVMTAEGGTFVAGSEDTEANPNIRISESQNTEQKHASATTREAEAEAHAKIKATAKAAHAGMGVDAGAGAGGGASLKRTDQEKNQQGKIMRMDRDVETVMIQPAPATGLRDTSRCWQIGDPFEGNPSQRDHLLAGQVKSTRKHGVVKVRKTSQSNRMAIHAGIALRSMEDLKFSLEGLNGEALPPVTPRAGSNISAKDHKRVLDALAGIKVKQLLKIETAPSETLSLKQSDILLIKVEKGIE